MTSGPLGTFKKNYNKGFLQIFDGLVELVWFPMCRVAGFVGVYLAGYVLETTGKWTSVFSQTAFICFAGGIIFLIFGTGKQIVK